MKIYVFETDQCDIELRRRIIDKLVELFNTYGCSTYSITARNDSDVAAISVEDQARLEFLVSPELPIVITESIVTEFSNWLRENAPDYPVMLLPECDNEVPYGNVDDKDAQPMFVARAKLIINQFDNE